jgi:NAD-dependent dihydropyrimidine dehydrogenase PreA subunit
MAALFIDVVVDAAIASDAAAARKLAEVCPVDIFQASDAGVQIAEANLDECTLCELCTQAFPGQVELKKLYEE